MPKVIGPRAVIRNGAWIPAGTEFEVDASAIDFLTEQDFAITDVGPLPLGESEGGPETATADRPKIGGKNIPAEGKTLVNPGKTSE